MVDAERMCFFLEKGKHTLIADPADAEAIIVNTCGFTRSAKEENIDVILRYAVMKKKNPRLKLIVSGCLTERYKDEILKAIPEIDNAIGIKDQAKILDALSAKPDHKKLLDSGEFNDTAYVRERNLVFSGLNYAYLKISEGCGRSCAFCAIPSIRGKQRSRAIEDIVKEARFLLDNGVQELILVSEDTISYGLDLYKKKSLIRLLKELVKLDFRWIRIMYLFPEESVLEVARFIRDHDKICNYMDIPLQHASGKIIKSMKRSGDSKSYLALIEKVRAIHPEIRIRSSFISGFPGETAKDHRALMDFLEKAELDRVGFFEYSREEGTPGYSMKKQVNTKTIRERIGELASLQEKISRKKLKRLVGKTLVCVHDGMVKKTGKNEFSVFRTEYDAPEIDGVVYVPYNGNDRPVEDFTAIRIQKVIQSHDLSGVKTKRK